MPEIILNIDGRLFVLMVIFGIFLIMAITILVEQKKWMRSRDPKNNRYCPQCLKLRPRKETMCYECTTKLKSLCDFHPHIPLCPTCATPLPRESFIPADKICRHCKSSLHEYLLLPETQRALKELSFYRRSQRHVHLPDIPNIKL